jgi:hypothetical protein
MADIYKVGLGSVGSYQTSGIPYVLQVLAPQSGSAPLEVSFPNITKFIVIKNVNANSKNLKVGFSINGLSGNNYFTLAKGESFEGELRVSKLYLIGEAEEVSASVIAGLTGIESSQLWNNWSGSAGVG